jgi:hypothetical protein
MKYLMALSALIVFISITGSAQTNITVQMPTPPPAPAKKNSPQCPYGGTYQRILQNHRFKIKAASTIDSKTARVADYVEFKTMEPIYSRSADELFGKDTSIFALVTRRKHRHFPVTDGKIELELKPLINWDGTPIEIAIARHGALNPGRETREEAKRRNVPCKDPRQNCVAGRTNREVSVLTTAVAGASGGVVSSIKSDDTAKFILATTFFSLAHDVGELLNGTDATIASGEIFDLVVEDRPICKKP